MTGRVPPLNLKLVSQAYEKYDINSPPLSPIQTPHNSDGLPRKSAFDAEFQADLSTPRRDEKVDEFEAFEIIDTAFERLSHPVLDLELYQYMESYINGHRIVSDFKEHLFLMHMQVMPVRLSDDDELPRKSNSKGGQLINYHELRSLCADNIQTIFRICSKFIERYNKIQIPKYERKNGKKIFHEQLKFALEEKNKAILKCVQDLCIAVMLYYKAVDERYFYNELSNRFRTVACLARDNKSMWTRLAISLPMIPNEESGDLMFPNPNFSITGCLAKGVADIVRKANEIEKRAR